MLNIEEQVKNIISNKIIKELETILLSSTQSSIIPTDKKITTEELIENLKKINNE